MGGGESAGAAARLLRPGQGQTRPSGRSRRRSSQTNGSGLAHVDQGD